MAVDCGIVVNPDAAKNMGEGGIIDSIGNALFGEVTFKDGVPRKIISPISHDLSDGNSEIS